MKINKLFIISITIILLSISCSGEEYNKYLEDNNLLEVAKIELNNFIVHIAIDKDEYIEGFNFLDNALDLSFLHVIIVESSSIKLNIKTRTFNGRQPLFNNGKVFLLACTALDSGERLIIYYSKEKGYKEFRIDYSKISQLIYFDGKIYTTWNKSIDYLRIIDVETGKIVIPKTDPLFYGYLFIINNKLYAANYSYSKRKYTEIYQVIGDELIPYIGEKLNIPKRVFPDLDDYLVDKWSMAWEYEKQSNNLVELPDFLVLKGFDFWLF